VDTTEAPSLVADCGSCFALCCVLLPFTTAAGFGMDKPGGAPCPNLATDDRCGIHATLREDGWPGCSIFECFGAGQQVSQVTYGGVSWREQDNLGEMNDASVAAREAASWLMGPAGADAAPKDRVAAARFVAQSEGLVARARAEFGGVWPSVADCAVPPLAEPN